MDCMLAALDGLARCFIHHDGGQDLLEYGLLAALIAVIAIAGVATVGGTVNTVFWQAIAQAI